MKRIVSFLLCFLLVMSVIPFRSADTVCASETVAAPQDLKILCIGNSFACDTIEHVANIALNLGVETVKLGCLYIGGCSINKHYDNAVNNNASYEYFVNTGSGWSSTLNHSILSALESETWDWISIQHGTGDGSLYASEDSYTNLPALIEYVKQHSASTTKIAFNMTWVGEPGSHAELISYNNDQLAYYNAIAALTRDTVLPTEGLDRVSPTGTAVQNARTSEVGILTRDNYHLNYTTGRYIAGLTFFKALTGVDISPITWSPDNMTQYMIDVAIESANNAIDTPFEVTASTLTPPVFEWPENIPYGSAATPAYPYYAHAAKEAPEVAQKVNLMTAFNYGGSTPPTIRSTLATANGLGLSIDLNETPYLYYSFVVPEGSDFTFSLYSNTTYSPWLMFLDVTKGNAQLNEGAEAWDAAFTNNRAQYATVSQTGCIDMRQYLVSDELKWIVNQMKFYGPKSGEVIVSYFFFGSEAIGKGIYQDADSLLPTDLSQISQNGGIADYTIHDDGSLTLSRAADSDIAWPSIKVTCDKTIDLSQTPYLHLKMNTDSGCANGHIYYTDADGNSGYIQISHLVNGNATDFTTSQDLYVDLSAYFQSEGSITIDSYTLSVYGVVGAAVTWTAISTAEYVEVPFINGDVNIDGTVSTSDCTAILRHILATTVLDSDALSRADYNGDGNVSSSDVRAILLALVST